MNKIKLRNWYYKKNSKYSKIPTFLLLLFLLLVTIDDDVTAKYSRHVLQDVTNLTNNSCIDWTWDCKLLTSSLRCLVPDSTIRIKITNSDTAYWLTHNGYTLDSNNVAVLPIESEYVPNVVMPEDGSDTTPYESLKAQAVISRTIAYYKKLWPANVNYDCDDTNNCQIYRHTTTYSATYRVEQAVYDTEGVILKWSTQNTVDCSPQSDISKIIISSMYVNGDALSGTDKYVTYNEGKSGECISQTTLGTVTNPPSLNPYNRGALGQIQSHSLANNGYTWQKILKYFYGDDIIIEYI